MRPFDTMLPGLSDQHATFPTNQEIRVQRAKTLVLFHCYYPELFEEINRYIMNLDGVAEYDVVVSVTSANDTLIHELQVRFPNYQFVTVENRGQDVGAAIAVIGAIELSNYDFILKVHTKRNRSPRPNWRQDLLQPILGSKENARAALRILSNRGVSMVGSKILYMNRTYANGENIKKLTRRLRLEDWDSSKHRFFAGSIFWTKVQVFSRIKAAGFTIQDFEPGYQGDLLLQHAFERVFGLLAVQEGQQIVAI